MVPLGPEKAREQNNVIAPLLTTREQNDVIGTPNPPYRAAMRVCVGGGAVDRRLNFENRLSSLGDDSLKPQDRYAYPYIGQGAAITLRGDG